MKQVRLLGLAMLALFALSAVVASAAFALPELLPGTAGTVIKGKNDNKKEEPLKLTTAGGTNVECETAESSGAVINDTSSSFHIKFTGCKSETFGVGCTGTETGDTSGVILTLGTANYVFDHLGTGEELGVAILITVSPNTVFNCSFLAKAEVKGSVECLVLKPLETNTIHLIHCAQTNGVETVRSWWNDSGVEQKASLLTSINGGTFEESGEQALATLEVGSPAESVAFEKD